MKVTAENWVEVLLKKNTAKDFYQNYQPQDIIHCVNNSGRIDDLVLSKYRETLDEGSPEIVLLSPAGDVSSGNVIILNQGRDVR